MITLLRLRNCFRQQKQSSKTWSSIIFIIASTTICGKIITDVIQKKLTLPLIHLLQQGNRLSDEARDILENPSERGISRLRYLLAESGSIGYAQAEADRYVRQARDILKLLPANDATATLDQMMQRIVQRNS